MIIYGLTGGIGSGKSTVAKLIEEHNIPVLYADKIARELVQQGQPALKQIIEHFGKAYLLDNGELDRAHLRKTIFENKFEKQWLENLLHPLIKQTLLNQIKKINHPFCVLEVPLLFEAGFDALVDKIITVDCPETIAIKRILKRDHCSEETAKQMISSQISRDERIKRADSVINNDGSLEDLMKSVGTLCSEEFLKPL